MKKSITNGKTIQKEKRPAFTSRFGDNPDYKMEGCVITNCFLFHFACLFISFCAVILTDNFYKRRNFRYSHKNCFCLLPYATTQALLLRQR